MYIFIYTFVENEENCFKWNSIFEKKFLSVIDFDSLLTLSRRVVHATPGLFLDLGH
jgi:hypothetical protein